MAFLDNSGDIILDAVLTDEGRRRIAEGIGTFNITKFALGDDEIDYSLYDKSHRSGSSYYDLEIMQSPILEAFTNNQSSLNSKLLSITNPEHLYLPIILLNEKENITKRVQSGWGRNTFTIPVDVRTLSFYSTIPDGVIKGAADSEEPPGGGIIRLDQGLNTNAISARSTGELSGLRETAYLVSMDNRLCSLYPAGGARTTSPFAAVPSAIDDDDIATYVVGTGADEIAMVSSITDTAPVGETDTQVLLGPRDKRIEFRLQASTFIAESDYLFDTFGTADTSPVITYYSGTSIKYIDTTVTVQGLTTGYKIFIPIRLFKEVS
jgi:hypothetical protein